MAPLLLPPVWSTAPCMATRQLACAECAASSWHMAGSSWRCWCSLSPDAKRWASKHRLEWYTGWNEAMLLAEHWGQIAQSWQEHKSSSGRKEQRACCAVTEALGRGLAGRWASWWVKRPKPAPWPCPAPLPASGDQWARGGWANLDHSDNARRIPILNACLNSAACNSTAEGLLSVFPEDVSWQTCLKICCLRPGQRNAKVLYRLQQVTFL